MNEGDSTGHEKYIPNSRAGNKTPAARGRTQPGRPHGQGTASGLSSFCAQDWHGRSLCPPNKAMSLHRIKVGGDMVFLGFQGRHSKIQGHLPSQGWAARVVQGKDSFPNPRVAFSDPT